MKRTLLLLPLLLLAGGCAALKMEDTKVVETVPADKVVVTFVRPSIVLGDAYSVYLWDGDHFIGALSAGTMIQYETTPGEHLFLGRSENWTYATGNLEAGRRYLIKANMFPGFAMRAAFASMPATDERLPGWYRDYRPKVAPERERRRYEAGRLQDTEVAIQNFRGGAVTSFAQILSSDAH